MVAAEELKFDFVTIVLRGIFVGSRHAYTDYH